ncbi:MAG TPA: acetate/propionate family kinase [Gaiellales bacterium]
MGDVLVQNAGSTSLKLNLVSESETSERLRSLAAVDPAQIDAVAHRIVHGGERFRSAVLVDDEVRAAIGELRWLAPLHNTPALRALDVARKRFPGVPHVAVFDTAFHATIPPAAATYAVPRRWREEWGVRRYGFHGLSVAWSAERAPAVVGRPPGGLRLVVCHLGGGSSVTAVADGRSLDTTMGFSPIEGVPMATRSGSVDPGALIAVLRRPGMDADALDQALNHESGMRGLAGGEGLMLELERRAGDGDPDAELAVDVFVHRVAGAVAAMAVAAGGLDVLVFTAGIGEHSPTVRERVCRRLAFMGVAIEPAMNAAADGDCDIAPAGAPVRVAVIAAREEIVAARGARAVIAHLP